MYVWRIPLPFFGALVAGTSLALVWIGVASLRHHWQSVVARGLLLSVATIAAILSPLLVEVIIRDELERMAKLGFYIHYSTYIFLSPAFLVVLLFWISRLIFPRRGSESSYRWHLKFWLTAFAFTVLNIANWCSPGWCERFGFPFPYSWWSDAIISMNGENLTEGLSLLALTGNMMVFLFVVAVLSRSYRRSLRQRNVQSDPTPPTTAQT